MKINVNFCFYTILWYRKGLHKTFGGTTKKRENKLKLAGSVKPLIHNVEK